MNRLIIALCALPLLLVALAGCKGGGDGPRGGASDSIRINIATEPPTLDWTLARDYTSITVIINMMEGLTRFGKDMLPEPGLAESWDISADKRRITFHLRPDVRWSDGVPLRAGDFEYSWKRLLDPATGADYAYFLYDVAGAQAYNTGKSKDPGTVGVRAIDDRTLEVRLRAPASYFLSLLTFVATYPLRQDVVAAHGSSWTEPGNIITLGPFLLDTWRHHERITLTRNPAYWAPPAPLQRIEMVMSGNPSSALALYESGELDFLDGRDIPTLEVPRLRDKPDFRKDRQFRGNYIGFNSKKPPFDKVLVRRAFSAAIDRESLVGLIQGAGVPATSWIPMGMLGFNGDIGIGFDPDQARGWLAEAGFPSGKGFPEVSFLYPNLGSNKIIAVALQSMWKRHLGVVVKLNGQEWKVYLSTLKVDPPDIWRAGWGADFPDPHNFMNLFECNSGNNHTRWCSPEFDALIVEAALVVDPALRVPLYDRAQRLLIEQAAVIAPFYISIQYSMVKPYVEGLDINELSLIYLDKVSIKRGD